jgi:hypothetical protein
MTLLLAAGAAFGQGETAADAVQKTNLLQLIKTGGWAMWPLGGFSFFMVALIIQNFVSLRSKTLLHTEMMPELLKMMLEKKCKTALIYCRKNPSMFANTFGAGLERCIAERIPPCSPIPLAPDSSAVWTGKKRSASRKYMNPSKKPPLNKCPNS